MKFVAIVRNHFCRTQEQMDAGIEADQVRFRIFEVDFDQFPGLLNASIVDNKRIFIMVSRVDGAAWYYMNELDATSEVLNIISIDSWGGEWIK